MCDSRSKNLLLHALMIEDAGVAELSSRQPLQYPRPSPDRLCCQHLLNCLTNIFPTPLPLQAPQHVRRYCQSSTCDTLLLNLRDIAIEPGLPEGVVKDPVLEHGFQVPAVEATLPHL